MATAPHRPQARKVDYPTGDGKPMAETDIHRINMLDIIETLKNCFATDPLVYVSGNLLIFYEEGNRRNHVSPDVFLVRGVENKNRLNYLIWEEGKAPDFVLELTSKTTKREDQITKLQLYRDILRVPEYYQFDPTEDYLNPPLQGFRLIDGDYRPIEPVNGRLSSEVLGLHLERDGQEVRFYDPLRCLRVLKPTEGLRAENERLREENETLRRRLNSGR